MALASPTAALAQDGDAQEIDAEDVDTPDEATLDEYAEMSLEELLGVVVSASQRQESLAQAPATVSVLEEDDIRASGARSVPELLRLVPGVQVVRSAPGAYVVALRGMGALTGNNLIVLLDGVPLNSPLDGEVDWSTLPVSVDDIERIEVVRGPVSPVHGANAYTGVIRIDTRRAPDGDGAAGGARLTGGMDTAVQPYVELSGWFHGRRGPLSASIQGQAQLDDTFSTGATVQQPGLRTLGVASRIGVALSDNVSLSLSTGASLAERAALDYLITEAVPQVGSRVYGRLELAIEDLVPELDAIRVWTRGSWLARRSDPEQFAGFNYGTTDAVDTRGGFDFQLSLPAHIHVAFGADGGMAYVDAPFIHPQENAIPRAAYGGYVNADIDIEELFMIAAAVRTDVSAFAPDPQVSARGSLVFHQPDFSLRLSASNSYRNPTYVEVASQFRDPNTDLILLEGTAGLPLPRVEQVEAAVAVGIGGRLTLRANVYFARAADLIVGDFTTLTRKTYRTEEQETMFLGGELEVDWTISDEVSLHVGGAGLGFLTEPQDPASTVGVAGHNSLVTARAELRGNLPEPRLDLSAGVAFFSERTYNVRVGIPPQLVRYYVPHFFRIHATGYWRPIPTLPLDLGVIAVVHLPHELAESPLPSAGALGSRFMLSVRVRTD